MVIGLPQVPQPPSMMGNTSGLATDPMPKLKSKNPRNLITGPPGIDMLWPPMSTSAAWVTGGGSGTGAVGAPLAASAAGAAAGVAGAAATDGTPAGAGEVAGVSSGVAGCAAFNLF